MSTKTLFWIGLTLLVIASISYFNIRRDDAVSDAGAGNDAITIVGEENKEVIAGGKPTEGESDKTTLLMPGSGVEVGNKPVPDAPARKGGGANMSVPNLDRSVVFESGYSIEQREKIEGQVKILTDALKIDPDRFNEWTDLGLLLKSSGDYEGARQAWEYAGAMRPENSLSFSNLGVLYGYYLNKPLKAEANLLHAIENEPLFLNHYMRLTDFYLEVMKNKNAALGFLNRSIAKYPEWEDLKKLKEGIAKQ